MNLIIVDTREKGNKKILEYFDKIGQDYIISKLDSGDYIKYKDYSTIIDKKDGLLELLKASFGNQLVVSYGDVYQDFFPLLSLLRR